MHLRLSKHFSTTTSIPSHIKVLKTQKQDLPATFSAIQSLFAITQQESTLNETKIDKITTEDPLYTWSVSPAKGATIDALFQATQPASSQIERETIATESSSDPEALVYGCVPPRSLSTLFDRLTSKGILRNFTSSTPATFYDLGSGDGLACFTAAMLLPFQKIVGYEILPSLIEVAHLRAQEYSQIAEGLGDTADTVDFHLQDCRYVDWSDGSVIFANAPCFDHALMDVLGEKVEHLTPGTLFISLGQRIQSEHLELIDQILLPANGLGMYGEPSLDGAEHDADSPFATMGGTSSSTTESEFDDDDDDDQDDQDDEDDEDDASADGLFTFNVYQRVHVDGIDASDVLLPSMTDSACQQSLRTENAFQSIMDIVISSKHDDKARATSILLLRECMTSHPSARQMLELGVLDTIFEIMNPASSTMLQVCGVLLLNELSTTRHGQIHMLKDSRMKDAMTNMLNETISSAPVVAAGVEIAHNLSSGRLGCAFLNQTTGVKDGLLALEDDGRAADVVERMERKW
tara:strand:+ start:87 stop:1646 length:1560 start_codon:yes stop_codon:yes gene_type:complete